MEKTKGFNPGRGYDRLLDILEVLARDEKGYTLSELSRRINTPKSTTHLIIKSLMTSKYLNFNDETKRYYIGPKLIRLAFRIVDNVKIQSLALPFLEQLAMRTTQDVYLAIRNGTRIIYICKVEGAESLRLNIGLGIPNLMHCTSAGKVFLAWGNNNLIEEVINTYGLRPVTPYTITNRETLENELAQIRKIGYAISDEEGYKGVYGIAAPIWNREGKVEAALHISCIKSLAFSAEFNLDELINALLDTAKKITDLIHGEKVVENAVDILSN